MKRLSMILLTLALIAGLTAPAHASKEKMLDNGASVIEEILSSPDENIPSTLLGKAKGIIIIPNMIKGGFFFGGRFGMGVASVRHKETGKWGPPAFVNTLGGSFGFQFGAEAVDLILLVMTHRGMDGLLSGQFNLGGDIAVVAGPVGRHAEANMDILAQGEIYSYSRSKGIFGGVSVKGSAIHFDNDANEEYYGKPYKARELLLTQDVTKIPESARRFMDRLNRAAPPKKFSKNM